MPVWCRAMTPTRQVEDAAERGAANLPAAIDRRPVTSIGLAVDPIGLAVPLGPAGRDNPSVMGGRVASPTLVGRLEELGVLEAAQGRAANGEPAVVLVGGEAGIGKTRLIAELADRCRATGARVLVGGCLPAAGDGLPYAPIVEALRPLPAELGVGAVRELIGPSWSELAHLLPSLGEPASGSAGRAAQARLFELLLGLLGRLGEQAPVLLVVEDLHWADRSTRELLGFLVGNLRAERLLVVVTYRSDEPDPDRLGPYLAELDRGGRVERLELARLDRATTVAQLTGILGASPAADLVEAVFVRSEGNPFFTEELLAAVRAGSGALPITVRDLLRGRVKGLPEQPRRVLAVAAVAGRQVSHRLLAAVAGLDDQQLEGALRQAVAHQLLVTRPGQGGYQFRHALLWEVVEADLLPGERARLHAGYAHALTKQPELAGDSPAVAAAELAAHWDAAGEPTRALAARVQAGLAAERARAFAEAARHYQRALELWERVADPGRPAGLDRVELLARAAAAVAFTGAAGDAAGLLQDALGRVDPAAEPVRAAVLLARLGTHRRVAGDEAGALAALTQAEGLVTGAPPSAEVARVLGACAYGLLLRARPEQAIACSEAAIAAARAVGARAEEATALRVLAAGLAGIGGLERALDLLLEGRRLAEEVEDAEAVMGTYMTACHLLQLAGREREAVEDAQQGYRRAHELGLQYATGSFVAGNLGFRLLETGRWGNASSSPGRRWPATPGAPSTCAWCEGCCWPGRGTSRPRGRSWTWRCGSARRTCATRRGWDRPSSRCGPAARTRRPPRSPRGCAAGPSATPPAPKPIPTTASGTRWRCAWRPTGPNRRRLAGRPRSSPRHSGGPPRWLPSWTGWPPQGRRRPATRTSSATCCWPGPSSRGWRAAPTPSGGARRPSRGSRCSIPSRPPTPASGRPRRCWPRAPPAPG